MAGRGRISVTTLFEALEAIAQNFVNRQERMEFMNLFK